MTNCSLSPPVTPLLFTTVTTSFHPPNPFSFPLPLSLIWKSPTPTTTNWKRIHYIGTSLTPWFSFYFILFFCHDLPLHHLSSPPSSHFSSSSYAIQILLLSSFSSSLMPLLPPWYCGLPVDLAACGLRTCPDSTPLSSTPLRLFSPVPCSLSPFWPPAPLLPPAVSKERYATLPLYSFRYVIILSSPFFITTVTWQGGHVLSHVVGFYLFLTTDGPSSEYRAMAGGGVCLRVCMTCFGCCGFVWEKYGENATKLQHFI